MTTKLVNQDQVTAGLRTVAQVLKPFVQKHMTRTYEKDWLPAFVRRHPRSGMNQEHLGDLGFLIWVLTKEERAFGEKVLPRRAHHLAHRVREARNLASHDQVNDLDTGTARTALQSMADFLTLLGEPGRANEVRQLTGRLRAPAGKTATAPHAVPPSPKPKSKRPKKPKQPQAPRPAPPKAKPRQVRPKIGCGAMVVLVIVALAVGWVFFGPRQPDPHEGKYKDEPLGARLNTGLIEVPSNYHLRFLDEPMAPLQGAYGGDVGFSAGQVSATDGRIVVLTRREKLGYATCRDTTRYTTATTVTKTLRICVTTDTGAVAGIAVKGLRRQGTGTFVKVHVVVWKGRKPKG
ncbi:MAG TPA: Swt1 family HEPN domain-containing protein [Thermomonospora sp.]|nr:Swt1 family HEPN domain-containing protein [Thermomonospora sp.]